MHVSLDVVHAHAHPKKRSYRTEEERKRAEAERREEVLRRTTSLLAQLLCPLGPLFSLPGLTEHWYVKHDASGLIVTSKPDPPLIVAAGAVTLVLALLANIALVLRLIESHPRLFTIMTMSLLSVHMLVNVVALTIFGIEHAHPDGYVLSTAFWLTAASGCVALIVVICLLIDGFATKWCTQGGTGVSGKQRSLIITFDLFCALILIGSVCYRYLITNVTYLDTVYFCIQSVLTVGLGDVVPDTTGARVFSLFYNTVGIVVFALLISLTRETALEAMQNEYKTQEKVLITRLRERSQGRESHHAGFFAHAAAFLTFGMYHSREQQEEEHDAGVDEEHGESGDGELDSRAQAEEEANMEQKKEKLDDQRFEEAIIELKKERDREDRSEIVVSFTLFLVFWVVGAAAFSALEGWSYWIGFYFVFVMSSSIGYGDFSPSTQGGRAFFCGWALVGAGTLTVLFSVLAEAYTTRFKSIFQRSWLNRLWIKVMHPPHAVEDALAREETVGFPSPPGSRSTTPVNSAHGAGDGPGKEFPELAPSGSDKRPQGGGEGQGEGEGKGERTASEKLVELLHMTREHLDHLILADGDAKTEHIDGVVRKVMANEGFSRRNREHVENDGSFKKFIYLRSLRTKLSELEELAQDALKLPDTKKDRPAKGGPSGSGDARKGVAAPESDEEEEAGDLRRIERMASEKDGGRGAGKVEQV